MLASKSHRGALKQTELVFAAELAKGNHGAAEGDRADGRPQKQLKPIACRYLVGAHALGDDAKRKGFCHRSHADEDGSQANHAVHESHQLGHFGHLDALGHQRARGTANDQSHQHVDHAQGLAA